MLDEEGSRERRRSSPRALSALRSANGPDGAITPETLAPIDHFHGKGVVATEEPAPMLQLKGE